MRAEAASKRGSVTTLYCPYDFNGGVPQKAHVLALDPEGEFVSLIHSDGLALFMDPDNGITLRAGGSTWLNLKDGKLEVVATSILLQGNVAVGANPAMAVPLALVPPARQARASL